MKLSFAILPIEVRKFKLNQIDFFDFILFYFIFLFSSCDAKSAEEE